MTDDAELGRQAASGVRWTATSAGVVTAVQVLQIVALPRLVSPEEYGLVAIAQVMAGFAQPFADLGVSAAIVQRQDATREQLSSLYWTNILAGVVVGIVVIAATPAVAWLYREPRVLPLVPLAAAPFAVIPWGLQFQLLLQKHLEFRRLAIIEITAAIAGLVVSVGAAVAGLGASAILLGVLVAAAVKSLMLVAAGFGRWRPSLRLVRADLDGYLAFGAYQMGERVLGYGTSRLDQLLIGGLLGAERLGYYNLAYQYVMLPMGRVNTALASVAFPVFARLQNDDERLRDGYTRLLGAVIAVNAPLLLGLAAVAPVLVPLVAGAQWTPAVPALQLLALVALGRAHGNPVGALSMAKGRSDLGFWWNIAMLVVSTPLVVAGGLTYGLEGVAVALIVVQIAMSPFNYELMVARLIGRFGVRYTAAITRPIAVAVVMAGVVVAADRLVHGIVAPVVQLVALVALGAAVYAALAAAFLRDEVDLLRRTLARG